MCGVENAVHCTVDKSMREDEHPWIASNPRGTLVIALLRRTAYDLLALFRSVPGYRYSQKMAAKPDPPPAR